MSHFHSLLLLTFAQSAAVIQTLLDAPEIRLSQPGRFLELADTYSIPI